MKKSNHQDIVTSLWRRLSATLLLCIMSIIVSWAQGKQTMLIINSYGENAPWSQSFAQPINQELSKYDYVHLQMISLNCAEIRNAQEYKRVSDKIFSAFADDTPEYVIMIGNFAFSLRDRILKEWGDIPMLLISRIDRYAPIEYYYAGYDGPSDWEALPKIADIRSEYNLTAIVTPDFAKGSVDFMHHVIPGLNKIVFISDNAYSNRSFDKRLRTYIGNQFPHIKYEWLQASDTTLQRFQNYMLNKHEHTGFLISTWANVDLHPEILGITGANLQLVSSSANPVFSLRDTYLSLGVLGGVFHDLNKSSEALKEVVQGMLAGVDMRTLPLYVFDKPIPIVNQQRMKGLGFTEENFPEGTKYIFRAPSVWEAYGSLIIACAVILLLLIVAVIVYISIQGKRIHLLKTHALFIKNMPWAYSKAKILYDKNGDVTDIEYILDDMNSAFMRMLTSNLLSDESMKIFPKDFIATKTSQVILSGQPVTFTYHFEKTDTYYEIMLCRINAAKLRSGQRPQTIDIFANNITKRIKAQNKLSTAMYTLDMTLNVARIIPWQWTVKTGKIHYTKFRTLRSMQDEKDFDATQPRHSIDLELYLSSIHPDDAERIRRLFEDFIQGTREHVHTEFKVMMQRKGKLRVECVEINAAVCEHNADGSPKLVIGSMLIITERKRQEEALIAAKERASESDRMKSAFLANMSHEIRTPLNAIVGFSGLITQASTDEEKQHYKSIIEHNNDLLLHLIDDVLDLAKIESNTLKLNNIDTDINDLMRSVYDTVRLRIKPGVVFNMVLGADECYLKTDPNRLSQVLINLLTNASKFTQKGSITFGYEINDDEIEFFVRDTGIGISQENQEKLFQRFSKLNNFVQGTGLGLSICKSFIEKMGGTIGVKSRGEGKGSTFWFTLPYIVAQKPKMLETAEGSLIESPIYERGSEVTILIAEDNDSNYILFESILSKYYSLIHARNGKEAVEMYRQYQPQLVIMDIRMPVMDGYEATAEIRKISQIVPIIAVTAHAMVTEKDKIMHSGFNGYLSKPVNANELLNAVKAQLSKRIFIF